MKYFLTYIFILSSIFVFAQNKTEDKALLERNIRAQHHLAEATTLSVDSAFVQAETEYRKALSLNPKHVDAAYNLGHEYYKKGHFSEALLKNQQAIKNATSKEEKHRAFHNAGNILMEEKKCKEAVEAYKNALRNNPADDETRYNLVLAKDCAKQQKDDDPQEDDKDGENDRDKEENKDKEEKENNEKEKEEEDKGDQDKKDEEKEKEDGEPKDQKNKDPKDGEGKEDQKQPKPGQMSPQQIKNLLEAMNNQEKKVQEKINAQKAKGVRQQTDKDW